LVLVELPTNLFFAWSTWGCDVEQGFVGVIHKMKMMGFRMNGKNPPSQRGRAGREKPVTQMPIFLFHPA